MRLSLQGLLAAGLLGALALTIPAQGHERDDGRKQEERWYKDARKQEEREYKAWRKSEKKWHKWQRDGGPKAYARWQDAYGNWVTEREDLARLHAYGINAPVAVPAAPTPAAPMPTLAPLPTPEPTPLPTPEPTLAPTVPAAP
jgi:hypothetical protein